MKNLKFLLALVAMTLFAGCPTTNSVKLDPNGVYLGDVTLYQADLIVAGANDAMVGFVTWEHQYRDQLAAVPAVRKLSTSIDLNGKQWIKSYFAVRDVYVASPTDAGKLSLTNALQVIRAALAEAATYMAQPIPSPVPVTSS
jgi:hypothetical protein